LRLLVGACGEKLAEEGVASLFVFFSAETGGFGVGGDVGDFGVECGEDACGAVGPEKGGKVISVFV